MNASTSIHTPDFNHLMSTLDTDQRRGRRLLIATVSVWTVWILMFVAAIMIPIITRTEGPARDQQVDLVQRAIRDKQLADTENASTAAAPANTATAPAPSQRPAPSLSTTSGNPVTPAPQAGFTPGRVSAFFAILLGGLFIALPIAGVILLVLTITHRRTASFNQIRASLAAMDAQLKILLAQQQLHAASQVAQPKA